MDQYKELLAELKTLDRSRFLLFENWLLVTIGYAVASGRRKLVGFYDNVGGRQKIKATSHTKIFIVTVHHDNKERRELLADIKVLQVTQEDI